MTASPQSGAGVVARIRLDVLRALAFGVSLATAVAWAMSGEWFGAAMFAVSSLIWLVIIAMSAS